MWVPDLYALSVLSRSIEILNQILYINICHAFFEWEEWIKLKLKIKVVADGV